MIWHELILEKIVTGAQLRKAISIVFKLDLDAIAVSGNIEKEFETNVQVICQTFLCKAKYPLRVTIYFRHEALNTLKEDVVLVRELSEELDSSILMSDSGVNPYIMLKVNPNHVTETINIQLCDYDDCEEIDI